MKKPLDRKNYGSIGHLPNSRLGEGDHKVTEGQAKIIWEKCRDYKDTIVVQEKLDGSNVGICKVNGCIFPLTRAGYIADSSPFEQHHMFHKWVMQRFSLFANLLKEGERVCGEWLALAHGTRYDLTNREPFVAFDLFTKENKRIPYLRFRDYMSAYNITTPHLLSYGLPISHKDILKRLGERGSYGALDPVEGYVCRVEREEEVDFLAKFVRPEKKDGIYFKETYGEDVWNWSEYED